MPVYAIAKPNLTLKFMQCNVGLLLWFGDTGLRCRQGIQPVLRKCCFEVFNVHHAIVIHAFTSVQCSSISKLAGVGMEPRLPAFCNMSFRSACSEPRCAKSFADKVSRVPRSAGSHHKSLEKGRGTTELGHSTHGHGAFRRVCSLRGQRGVAYNQERQRNGKSLDWRDLAQCPSRMVVLFELSGLAEFPAR